MSESISYASGTSERPLLGVTIPHFFDRVVAEHGGREALVSVHQDIRLTYSQLAERVNELARAFIASGFAKGDRVGIWSPNNVEWTLVQYATAKAGLILVNINPAYRVHELAYVLEQSGCKGLVIQNRFKTSDYVAMLGEVCPELESAAPGALRSAKFPELATIVSTTESETKGIYGWRDFLALAGGCSGEDLAPAARRDFPRARRCRITIFSTTPASSLRSWISAKTTGSWCRCRFTIASAW